MLLETGVTAAPARPKARGRRACTVAARPKAGGRLKIRNTPDAPGGVLRRT